MDEIENTSRRDFIKLSTTVGAGLVFGINIASCSSTSTDEANYFKPNIWLKIDHDSNITISISKAELGQGVLTSLAMIVAEELDADWNKVRIKQVKASSVYGSMITAGSKAIVKMWQPLRVAGATAREMLIAAAANKWSTNTDNCYSESGYIYNKVTNEKLSYGELVDLASQQPVKQNPALKSKSEFTLIGKEIPRIEAADKVTGKSIYGIDTHFDGLKYAAIKQAPVFGAILDKVNNLDLVKKPGVHVLIKNQNFVAVVADSYWLAQKVIDSLDIKWIREDTSINDSVIRHDYIDLIGGSANIEYQKGTLSSDTSDSYTADYESYLQAHVTMEPMNCTAYVHSDGCDIWAPTQDLQGAKSAAKNILQSGVEKFVSKSLSTLNLASDNINVFPTMIGGGFGRRLHNDYVKQAVLISKESGLPVKLIWSREEDIQHDFYRPYTYHRVTTGLDSDNKLINWHHVVAGPSRGRSVGGAANILYDISNIKVEYIIKKHGLPIGYWRSVGSSHNAFVIESHIDELANKLDQDPYKFRRSMLTNQRAINVIDKAVEMSGWGKETEKNQGLGIALFPCFGSIICHVADISIVDQRLIINRVISVVDCGLVINPAIVRSQIEGGFVYALSAITKSKITIDEGRVQQSNFNNYPVCIMADMPEIMVHIMESEEAPVGIGEVGVPTVAPAIANAVYAATGTRIRNLADFTSQIVFQDL